MERGVEKNRFAARRKVLFVCLGLFLGLMPGSWASSAPQGPDVKENGASRPGYAQLMYSPDQIHLPAVENELSRRYLRIMELWIPTAMAYYKDWPVRPNCGHFFGGVFWYGLETAVPSFILALAASSPEYDAAISGYSKDELRTFAITGLRYLCFTHDTGPKDCVRPKKSLGRPEPANTKWGEKGKGFFFESQAGKTIALMNITTALLDNGVDAETLEMLTKINLDYLDRFKSSPPRHGVYYNTQIEENGWASTGLIAAGLFLSGHPESKMWLNHSNWWAFSTVTMPWDHYNQAEFTDGKTVSKLCNKKFTTLPDAMAENHGIVHPLYLGLGIEYLGVTAMLYHLWGRTPPPHLFWNRKEIYHNLKTLSDLNGYPHRVQGMDWPYFDMAAPNIHAPANLFLNDPTAAFLEIAALEWTEKAQKLNNGRMYDKRVSEICHGPQDPILMNEFHCAGIGLAYLSHRLMGVGQKPVTKELFLKETSGVKSFPYAGFLFHKHPKGQVSFSWRNRETIMPQTTEGVMLMGAPRDSMRVKLKVKDHPSSITPIALNVNEKNDRAAIVLVQDLAQKSVRRKVFFATLPDANTLIVERLVARKAITVNLVRQGRLSIINEKYACAGEDGRARRTLYFPGGRKTFYGFVSKSPEDDIIYHFDNPGWVNVDDKMTLIFKGTGSSFYRNRHFFKTWYATADDLVLSVYEGKKDFNAHDLVAELVTLVCPEQTHHKADPGLLRIGQTSPDIESIRVGDWLCLANLTEGVARESARFHVSENEPVPIFPGTWEIINGKALYHLDLGPMETRLYRSMGNIQGLYLNKGSRLKIDALEKGPAFLTNTGSSPLAFMVQTGDRKEHIALEPGELRQVRAPMPMP